MRRPRTGSLLACAVLLLEAIHATPDPEAQDTLYGFRQGWAWFNHPDEVWIEEEGG